MCFYEQKTFGQVTVDVGINLFVMAPHTRNKLRILSGITCYSHVIAYTFCKFRFF